MIKYLLAFLLATSSVLGQTLEDAKKEALNKSGVLFIYVSTPNSGPCVTAKKVITETEVFNNHTTVELDLAYALTIPNLVSYRTAPQLIMLDVGDVIEPFDKYATQVITKDTIATMLSHCPVPLVSEAFYPEFSEVKEEVATRIVKYSIATQYKNGAYNSTFNWGKIDHYLQAIERYWDVDFQRVTKGGLLFLQSNKTLNNNPRVAAVAGGSTIKISPTFNFGNGPWCGIVVVHETGHIYGGKAHNKTNPDGLMGPSGGSRILQTDYYWFRPFKFRNVPKPHEEPDWFNQWISQAGGDEPINTVELKFVCPEMQ